MSDPVENLTPLYWNAPGKPYHLKSLRYEPSDWRSKHPKEKAYICNLCGKTVVYTTSESGKRYLCDARATERFGGWELKSYTNRLYYRHLWHSKSCQPHEGEGIHPRAKAYIAKLKALRGKQ